MRSRNKHLKKLVGKCLNSKNRHARSVSGLTGVLKFKIVMVITTMYFMIFSQPVLAYRHRDLWVRHTVSPFDIPWLLFLILVLVIVTVASVTLSFLTRGRTSAVLRRVGIGMSWITGPIFIVLGSGVIQIGSEIKSGSGGLPYVEELYLQEPLLILFGIALLVTAFIFERRRSIKMDDWVLNINKSRNPTTKEENR